jgi:hypothetical protein
MMKRHSFVRFDLTKKKGFKKEKKMHCTKLKRDLKQSDPLSELMQN